MFFQILKERKLTATDLCQKHGFSARTAYRYINLLAEVLPLQFKRGRNGGVHLADSYKLPYQILSEEEYTAAIEALTNAYAHTADQRFLNAKRKLSAQNKADKQRVEILGDSNEILILDSENSNLSQTLLTLQECIAQRAVVLIRMHIDGNTVEKTVEPHALIFDGKAWRLFAFCHDDKAFQNLFIAYMVGVFYTEDGFRKRPFKREDILKLL